MRFVTWNLNGLDDELLDERTEAAVFTAILGAPLDALQNGATPSEPPDVIVFQEAVPRTFRAHLRPHLTAGGYTLHPAEPDDRETFEICAVRAPLSIAAVEVAPLAASQFGRMLTTLTIDSPNGTFKVLTAHFDSGKDGGPVRRRQLAQVGKETGADGIFGGDMNLRKAEWEAARDGFPLTDAWEALGSPDRTRVTWRRMTNGEEYKARFDRVLLGRNWVAQSMTPLGEQPLAGGRHRISDHIGLLVVADLDHP